MQTSKTKIIIAVALIAVAVSQFWVVKEIRGQERAVSADILNLKAGQLVTPNRADLCAAFGNPWHIRFEINAPDGGTYAWHTGCLDAHETNTSDQGPHSGEVFIVKLVGKYEKYTQDWQDNHK